MHCTFQCFWYWTVAARKPTLAQIAGLVNNYANGIHPGRARLRVQLRACRSTTHDEPERTVKLFDRVLNPREIRRRLGLNQEQFWTQIGVTQSGGSRYESGREMPKPVRELLRLVHVEQIDLSQVKRAFDLNGYVGLLYLGSTAAAIYIR